MDEDGFRMWLEAEALSTGTVYNQLSRARVIEEAFGDLERAHRRDRMAKILASLEYSRDDEAHGRALPGGLETSGDPVEMYRRLRVTARKVVRFLDARAARIANPAAALDGTAPDLSRLRTLAIPDERGRILDAKVEIGDGNIVLHSRSGPGTGGRNPHYRRALVQILERLAREGIAPWVFLDSAPARKSRPALEDRRLASQSELLIGASAAADLIIRRSNEGSRSHGAWRRLLLQVPDMPDYALISILDGTVVRRSKPLPVALLRQVERHHLDTAIEELTSGEVRHTRFNAATTYALLSDDGAPLPPKKVFGIALSEALRTYIGPDDFSSGDAIFTIIEDRGLKVVELSDINSAEAETEADVGDPDADTLGLPASEEERHWLEGNPKIVRHMRRERSGSAPAEFKAAFRKREGRLFCQRCERDYVEAFGRDIAEGCFEVHHTIPISKMRKGHATMIDQLRLLCATCHRATHREMASAR